MCFVLDLIVLIDVFYLLDFIVSANMFRQNNKIQDKCVLSWILLF